jgi:nicotinamide-nucleotide amidase
MTNKIILLAEELGKVLTARRWQCITVESCTGGGLSYWITSIPGSSVWFERGLVTYSNQAKQELLGVRATTLANFGAVSAETAQEMALGALQHSPAHISAAITGIAGPDGGSIDKPVGLVWIATATKQGTVNSKSYHFQGNRCSVREQSILAALQQLLEITQL